MQLLVCNFETSLSQAVWARVEDRLYKIRNSLNFAGTFRQLALFEPPIDPMALVAAVAARRDIGSVLAELNAPIPAYRYSVLFAQVIFDSVRSSCSNRNGAWSSLHLMLYNHVAFENPKRANVA